MNKFFDDKEIDNFGTIRYYLNDSLHKEDGPAIEYSDGAKSWYYNGKKFYVSSNEEFVRLVKLKAFW